MNRFPTRFAIVGEYSVNFINRDGLLKRRGDKIWMGLAAWLMALSTVWFSRTVRCNHMTESLLVLLPCVCPLRSMTDTYCIYIPCTKVAHKVFSIGWIHSKCK